MFGKKKTFCFVVEGIECNNCKARVEKAIMGVKGVKSAEAVIDSGEVKIEARSSVSEQDIRAAITSAGYKVN